jgi:hypothetical protein
VTAAGVFQTPQVSVLLETAATGLLEVVEEDQAPQVSVDLLVATTGLVVVVVVVELQPDQSSRL